MMAFIFTASLWHALDPHWPALDALTIGDGDCWMLAALPSNTEMAMLGALIFGAGVLLAILGKIFSAEKAVVNKVAQSVKAQMAEERVQKEINLGNQPIEIKHATLYVPQERFVEVVERLDGEMEGLREDLTNQLKESRAYIHDAMHKQTADMQFLQLAADKRKLELDDKLDAVEHRSQQSGDKIHALLSLMRETLERRFDSLEEKRGKTERELLVQMAESFKQLDHKRSVSIGTLHTALTATREKVAATEAGVAALNQQLHALDAKRESDRNQKAK